MSRLLYKNKDKKTNNKLIKITKNSNKYLGAVSINVFLVSAYTISVDDFNILFSKWWMGSIK